MIRTLTSALVLIICSAATFVARGQSVDDIAARTKDLVKKKGGCWKIYSEMHPHADEGDQMWVNWTCGKDSISFTFVNGGTPDNASKTFHDMWTSPTQSPNQTIEGYSLGDETHVFSNNQYSKASYVFFRKGQFVFRIDSNTEKGTHRDSLKNATKFARWLLEANSWQ